MLWESIYSKSDFRRSKNPVNGNYDINGDIFTIFNAKSTNKHLVMGDTCPVNSLKVD
jgi:hypothetical protein